MKRIVGLTILALSMAGCANVQKIPMSSNVQRTIGGETVATVRHTRQDFAAMTAGKAAFAMFGAVAAISEGNQLIKDNHVQDPAARIAGALSAGIEQKYGTRPLAIDGDTVDTDDIDTLVKKYSNAALLLDVQTINWSFIYYPTDWTHYRVMYSVRARLIDTKSKKVVAQGFCAKKGDDNDDHAPTYDQLLANGAARLKSEIAKDASACLAEFKTDTFKL